RVRHHPATKDKPQLQALMLEPVAQLTQAFAQGLVQFAQSREQPLVLVLDTYERAQSYLNQWLWQYLVEDTLLASAPVRLVVVGRQKLQADEGWRKLHQDRQLLYETQLIKFRKNQTENYLEQIGIQNGGKQAKIHKVTQGLPYYLNWVREQQDKGEELDFSQGNQAIAKLLLQGIDVQQRKILQMVACCRWFNAEILRFLLENDSFLGSQEDAEQLEVYFEWLKNSDFVESSQECYRLDDVARDVFRQSYVRDYRNQFRHTNALLADYFKEQADELFAPQSLLPDPYRDEEWRELIAEFLYYSLFGKGREGLQQYIEQVFVAAYLQEPSVFGAPLAFIGAEISEENRSLLPKATSKLLEDAGIVLRFDWILLAQYPEGENTSSKEKIEASIHSLLAYVGYLEDGFGKSIGLMYKALRCHSLREMTDSLLQVKRQAEQVSAHCRPQVAHNLFSNIGRLMIDAELYEDSLDCDQKAIELNPQSVDAWINQGIALSRLERYEEAIEGFQQVIDIDPKSADAWEERGYALRCLKRYEEAFAACEQALKIDPNNCEALNCQALTLSLLKDFEQAIAVIDQVINLKSQKVLYTANRGIILARSGRYTEALTDCNQAIKQYPKHVVGYYGKACCYVLQGEIEPALNNLQRAIDIAPRFSRIEAKHNPDFDSIRDEPRFRELMDNG
ncbi:MAG: tetratricopeptide repeat protein, partial [Symploca sp. SIO1B1]|nr:tetratricopeptide repeat protein [Symploca sp. SIO1B1]